MTETDFLIGFACGHVYHLDCLMDHTKASKKSYDLIDSLREQTRPDQRDEEDYSGGGGGVGFDTGTTTAMTRAVGPKISHAQVIRSAIGGGCPVCVRVEDGTEV